MHVGIFPGIKGLHNGIVLVVSLLVAIMKDKVALLEEHMVDISLFAWYDCMSRRYAVGPCRRRHTLGPGELLHFWNSSWRFLSERQR